MADRKKLPSSNDLNLRDLYVYDLSPQILQSLELMYFDTSTTEIINENVRLTEENLIKNNVQISTKERNLTLDDKECSACKISLDNLLKDDIREHYKSDFHRFNLKRSVNGLPPLSEAEFEKLMDDLDESISGSDEESGLSDLDEGSEKSPTIFEKIDKLQINEKEAGSNDETYVSFLNTKSPFIFFRSTILNSDKCFGIYKSTFNVNEINIPLESIKQWNSNQNEKYSALLMIGGGHFAGAIISHKPKKVKGNFAGYESLLEQSVDIIAHKTFHRYTTRRKQGGAQGASDNSRGKANSAGSSLRRHNEAALKAEVRELLKSWDKYFKNCQSIFVRANGSSNKGIMIGFEGAVLKSDDERIRSFPFTTKRATTSELKRAWISLSYLSVMDVPQSDEKTKKKSLQKEQSLINSQQQKEEKRAKELTAEEKYSVDLVGFIKKSRAPLLISYIRKNSISPNFELKPKTEYIHTPTLLHYAAANGSTHVVQVLLNTLKADPGVTNQFNKTPYDVSQNKATRRLFRIYRFNLGESYCDWSATHIGSPKPKEEFEKEDQDNKLQEELEKQRLLREELAKVRKFEEKKSTLGSSGKSLPSVAKVDNLSGLSDIQKQRIMREQRARAAEARLKKISGP